MEKGLSPLYGEIDIVVIQDIAQVAQLKAEIFSTYTPDRKAELSFFAIPCLVEDESRPEVLHPFFKHLSRLSVYLIHLFEEVKRGSDPLRVVGVYRHLNEFPDLFVGCHIHPSVQEGTPHKLIGVLQGGGFRCTEEDTVI